MKSVKEIERDTVIRIADEKQDEILKKSMKTAQITDSELDEWYYFGRLRDKLKKETL